MMLSQIQEAATTATLKYLRDYFNFSRATETVPRVPQVPEEREEPEVHRATEARVPLYRPQEAGSRQQQRQSTRAGAPNSEA